MTCPPHLSYIATLPQGVQKSHFSTLLFIYFRLFMLPQKKTNSNCCTAVLAVYLLLFSASYYLLLQEERMYWYEHVEDCSSGLRIPAQCGVLCDWSVSKKGWKHVLTQKVVTLNTCCDTACLTLQLPHITTASVHSHLWQPTTGSFQSVQHLKGCN